MGSLQVTGNKEQIKISYHKSRNLDNGGQVSTKSEAVDGNAKHRPHISMKAYECGGKCD